MNPYDSPGAHLCPKNPTWLPRAPLAGPLQPCPTPITKPLAYPTLYFAWGPGRTSLALIPSLAQTPSSRSWISCLARAKIRHSRPKTHRRPRKHHRPRWPKGPRHPLNRALTLNQACPTGSRNTMRVHGLPTKPAPVSTRRASAQEGQFTPPTPSLLEPTPPLAFRVSRYGR